MKEEYEILGFISIHRIMKKHWVYDNPFYFRAWIDMLWEVNHKDKKVLIEAQLIDCPRGSSLNSINTWISVFSPKHWTYDKVRTFFELLEKDNMITKQGLSKTTLISICNYSKYQAKPKQIPNTSQTDPKQSQNRSQTDPKQIPTNNKDNKEKNANNANNANLCPTAAPGEDEKAPEDLTLQKHPPGTVTDTATAIALIIDHLNKTTNKNRKVTLATRKLITALFQGGYTVQDCITVIDKKWAEWKGGKYEQWCKPSTLFSDDHFDDYLNQAGKVTLEQNTIQQAVPSGHVTQYDNDDDEEF